MSGGLFDFKPTDAVEHRPDVDSPSVGSNFLCVKLNWPPRGLRVRRVRILIVRIGDCRRSLNECPAPIAGWVRIDAADPMTVLQLLRPDVESPSGKLVNVMSHRLSSQTGRPPIPTPEVPAASGSGTCSSCSCRPALASWRLWPCHQWSLSSGCPHSTALPAPCQQPAALEIMATAKWLPRSAAR